MAEACQCGSVAQTTHGALAGIPRAITRTDYDEAVDLLRDALGDLARVAQVCGVTFSTTPFSLENLAPLVEGLAKEAPLYIGAEATRETLQGGFFNRAERIAEQARAIPKVFEAELSARPSQETRCALSAIHAVEGLRVINDRADAYISILDLPSFSERAAGRLALSQTEVAAFQADLEQARIFCALKMGAAELDLASLYAAADRLGEVLKQRTPTVEGIGEAREGVHAAVTQKLDQVFRAMERCAPLEAG